MFATFVLYIEFSPKFFIVSIVYFTSSAVKFVPLCHFTFSLSFIRYDLLSALDISVPSNFWIRKSSLTENSGSYINFDISCIFWFFDNIGFRLSKLEIPSLRLEGLVLVSSWISF